MTNNSNDIKYRDLKPGDVFIYDSHYYIKTSIAIGANYKYIAINLNDMTFCNMDGYTPVRHIYIELCSMEDIKKCIADI